MVGRGRAFDLAATMREVWGEEALAIGLIDRLVDDPEAEAIAIARLIAELPETAIRGTRWVIRDGADLVAALRAERAANAGWAGSRVDG